jgi:subtilisin family serine protease
VAHFEAAPQKAQAAALAVDPPVIVRRHLPVISPRLQSTLLTASNEQRLPVILVPSRRLDLDRLSQRLTGTTPDLRRATVLAAARLVLEQSSIELALNKANTDMRELWLPSMLAVQLTPSEIAALADDPNVGRLWLDDQKNTTFGATANTSTAAGVNEWHIGAIGADTAWSRGFDGDGVLIGHIDSGAAYDHPDLMGHMWDGGIDWPNHGWDSVDEDNDPYEGDPTYGHGTHTAGLVVGDGDNGQATGSAPGAELMILRAIPGYFADMIEAMQFALDNGPVDLFTMSAGWDAASGDLKEANRVNAEVLLSADIPWICAAGNGDNYGGHHPVPTDIASPGDCPNPVYGDAGHSAVITVGAIGASDAVWSGSSVGPTSWDIAETDYTDYPYPPGLMKPDLAAPGDLVTSLTPAGGYVTYSGTSMATPLVAGAVAILMQASPAATTVELATALELSSVDIGSAGRDNQTGAGRLNIPGALDQLPSVARETITIHNDGPLPLHMGASCQSTWLSVSLQNTTVLPNDSTSVLLDFDITGLSSGLHYDVVTFASDDPASPHVLNVSLAIGDVTDVDGPPVVASALAGVPNPFNPRTELRFELAAAGQVSLVVMDLRGRRVRTLVDGVLEAGARTVSWNGLADDGRTLSGGVYLARLVTSSGDEITKLTLLR